MSEATRSLLAVATLWVVVVGQVVGLLAAVPVAWSWRLSGLAAVGYVIAVAGVTVGFHRCLTHGSFKARRWLRLMLAVVGPPAVEGPRTERVADPDLDLREAGQVHDVRWPGLVRLAAQRNDACIAALRTAGR